MNTRQPAIEQLASEWETFSDVPMPLDQSKMPEQTSFEPPFVRDVQGDVLERHEAAVLFLAQQEDVSSQLIHELQTEMASLTGSGAKPDGGRHIARAAIRAEALAHGYVDFDAFSMEGAYIRAVDYTE
jgi:hypothetical protein